MNIDGETYLFYDKFAGGTHGFSNPLVSNYKIDKLFEDVINRTDTKYCSGDEALTEYNKLFRGTNFQINEKIDSNIYTLHLFQIKDTVDLDNTIPTSAKPIKKYAKRRLSPVARRNLNLDSDDEEIPERVPEVKTTEQKEVKNEEKKKQIIDIVITVFSVNNEKLSASYNKSKIIPNNNLLVNACRFHLSYENNLQYSHMINGIYVNLSYENNSQYDSDSDKIVDYIAKDVVIPKSDIMELAIDNHEGW